MKVQANKHRRELQITVGDLILVKLQPYCQTLVAFRKNQKLGMHYFGPFEVLQETGTITCKLKLPPTAKIHPLFHISLLKKFIGQPSQQYLPLSLLTTALGPTIQPLRVVAFRNIMCNTQLIPQVLIQWNFLDEQTTTWEDVAEIRAQFPNFNLEDKVPFNWGSILTYGDELEKEGELVRPLGHMEEDPLLGGQRRNLRKNKKE